MFALELQAMQFAVLFVSGSVDRIRTAARNDDLGAVSLEMVVLIAALVVGAIAIAAILVNKAKAKATSIVTE